MRFTADRKELTAAVQRASQGLSSRPQNPVHAGILVDAGSGVDFTAGDGDTEFTAGLDCDTDVTETGSAILPGKMLAEIMKYFTGDTVTIAVNEDTAEITAGKSAFTLAAQDGSKYPSWSSPPAPVLKLDGGEFSSAVQKVAPAASKADMVLGTVCLSAMERKLFITCTDRRCLGIVSLEPSRWLQGEFGEQVLVPVSVMERFARIAPEGTVSLGWDDRLVALSTAGTQVVSRQVAGKYFGWLPGLRDPGEWVMADTDELTRAVRMAALAAGDESGITFTFGKDDLTVSAQGQAQSASRVTTGYQGDTMSFLLGADMIIHGLAGCGSVVQMAFAVKPRPVLAMRSGGLRWIVQPRRELAGGE